MSRVERNKDAENPVVENPQASGARSDKSAYKEAATRKPPTLLEDLLFLVAKIAVIALFLVIIFPFLFGIKLIKDDSMYPGLRDGDLVIYYRMQKNYVQGDLIAIKKDGKTDSRRVGAIEGDTVDINHDNGLETYYAHLSKRHVAPGTRVRAGEEIGLCGNTGRSRGSHLHFEIRYNGNAINPEDVISCETHTLIKPMLHLTKDSFRKVAKRGYSNQSPKSRVGNYSNGGKTYKIRTGDTLSRIAKRNGTTVKKLCQLNGLKETSVLKPGRTIRIR